MRIYMFYNKLHTVRGDNGCTDFDTVETYTANVQNKKRIFADEILRV